MLNETPPKGCLWSGERLTKIQTTSRPDHIWRDPWTRIGKNAQTREKQEWAIEKPKVNNARRLRGIDFIDPEGEECEEIIKKRKGFSCITEAHESTRQRIESVTKRTHEEHIAGKGHNSVKHYKQCIHSFRCHKR